MPLGAAKGSETWIILGLAQKALALRRLGKSEMLALARILPSSAQDWMDDDTLNALWREITRTARPGAKVIFRTAGRETILPGRVLSATLRQWQYHLAQSVNFHTQDRSAIYGGFHLYTKLD